MSRIGIKEIKIEEGVNVTVEDQKNGSSIVSVKGPLGELTQRIERGVTLEIDNGIIKLKRSDDSKKTKSLHGLYRSLISNMVLGVKKGYEKQLEIVGIGFKAEMKGPDLYLTLGANHPYIVHPEEKINFTVDDKVNIKIEGIDKQKVGEVAAKIRAFHKPEPYKGKGVRYVGEYVRRKAGKAAKSASE